MEKVINFRNEPHYTIKHDKNFHLANNNNNATLSLIVYVLQKSNYSFLNYVYMSYSLREQLKLLRTHLHVKLLAFENNETICCDAQHKISFSLLYK